MSEYERRLFRVFAVRTGVERSPGGIIEDVWLEDDYPDTEIAIVLTFNTRPGCRYVFRCAIWTTIAGASPEAHAYEIDIGLQDWTGRLRSISCAPGSTYELRAARVGVRPRRPDPGSQT